LRTQLEDFEIPQSQNTLLLWERAVCDLCDQIFHAFVAVHQLLTCTVMMHVCA
jgi:hypothetical protein